jgi:hypothetical protein
VQYFLPESAEPLTAPSTLVEIPTALWQVQWDYRPGEQNVADALSRRDVATSWQDSVSVVKALAVCAAAILSGMYDRSSEPSQAERLDRDQSCASTLTFDLPPSLLKSLQLESQVLCKQIRQDANRPSKLP